MGTGLLCEHAVGLALPILCLGLVVASPAPISVSPPGGSGAVPPLSSPARPSAPIRGLGPRLAAQARHSDPAAPLRFLARGLDPRVVRGLGGQTTAQLGPVIAGWIPAGRLAALASAAVYVEAPAPLRPALDVSRVQVQADQADFAEGFASAHRGSGVLIAAYDTGVDLSHPDFRTLDGTTRVAALWDQTLDGQPPPGKASGDLCARDALVAGACRHRDREGHGTQVLAVAASSGPRYRGVAPEAELVVAASADFEMLLDALDWFRSTAAELERPMVVNLSLSGQEGPHDGTSLESQALDAYAHPVVVAAGNEGATPVHALVRLDKGDVRQVALRFPILPQAALRRAVVDIWGDVGLPLGVQVRVVAPGGALRAETETVGPGEPGGTWPLVVGTTTVGWASLDAEAEANPFNGQGHVRVGVELSGWEDDPEGLGYITVQVRGEGRIDLWVDSPASEPAPIRFDRDRVLGTDDQVLGDSDFTLSDLATTKSPVAVSAEVGRTEFVDAEGIRRSVGGTVHTIASFSSYGPTLSAGTTGPKPDLAAPGLLVIAARSQDAPMDQSGAVSPLYRAGAGTSLAAPHVTGALALLLGARPELPAAEAKALLLSSAQTDRGADPQADARWGAGRLSVADALARVVERKSGCRCVDAAGPDPWAAVWSLALLLGWARRRRAG